MWGVAMKEIAHIYSVAQNGFLKASKKNPQNYIRAILCSLWNPHTSNNVYDDDLVAWHISIFIFFFFVLLSIQKESLNFIQLFTEKECLFVFFRCSIAAYLLCFLNAQQQNYISLLDILLQKPWNLSIDKQNHCYRRIHYIT